LACGQFSQQANRDLLLKTAPRSPEHKGSMRLVATGRRCLKGDSTGQIAVLKAYPDALAVAEAGVEAVSQVLRAVSPAHLVGPRPKKLVAAAQASSRSGRSLRGRGSLLRILCDLRFPKWNILPIMSFP
jgi:hypothetical protein